MFVSDLGYKSSCDGMGIHDLKKIDFEVKDLPENRNQDQYFIVCVPQVTENDKLVKYVPMRKLTDKYVPKGN